MFAIARRTAPGLLNIAMARKRPTGVMPVVDELKFDLLGDV